MPRSPWSAASRASASMASTWTLHVASSDCFFEHRLELFAGACAAGGGRECSQQTSGEQSSVASAGRSVPPVGLFEQDQGGVGLASRPEQPGEAHARRGRDAMVAAAAGGEDRPLQGPGGGDCVAGSLLDPAEGRQVEGGLPEEPEAF